jgi:FKBP-type peptidyl-prolyl cis-trans isomerase 2
LKIQDQSKVEFSYVIEGMDGKVLESSDETAPMDYTHGQEDLPPKLEEALTGMGKGEEVVVEFDPGECYGDTDPEMIFTVPRTEFPEDLEIEVGEDLSIALEDDGGEEDNIQVEDTKDGAYLEARVMEVNPEAVILDANHPLAGIPIRFRVKVLSVN